MSTAGGYLLCTFIRTHLGTREYADTVDGLAHEGAHKLQRSLPREVPSATARQAEGVAQRPQDRSVEVELDAIAHEADGAHLPTQKQPEGSLESSTMVTGSCCQTLLLQQARPQPPPPIREGAVTDDAR